MEIFDPFQSLSIENPSDLLPAVDWVLCYVLNKSVRKVDQVASRQDFNAFDVKNASQVYHLRTLSILYIQVNSES